MKSDFIIKGPTADISITRQANGFPLIQSANLTDALYGLGYMHAVDRQMQMLMVKGLCSGRLSEWIKSTPELIEIDHYMRWIDFYGGIGRELEKLSESSMSLLSAYCNGANERLKSAMPLEFKLVRHPLVLFEPRDVLAILKMSGFLGLTQTQGQAERFIIELLREGKPVEMIRELFPAMKEKPGADYIAILKSLRNFSSSPDSALLSAVTLSFSFFASNNWAVSPSRTESKQAMVCGDPHLPLSLPSPFYPVTMQYGDRYFIGATTPGVPFGYMGRNADVSWTLTYGAADTVDYFIEEVRQGQYRRGNRWLPLKSREEILKPKGRPAEKVRFYETDIGIIEKTVTDDGYYLCYGWTGRRNVASESAESFLKLYSAKDVRSAQKIFAAMPYGAYHWVVADRQGNIGYQMSGLVPRRSRGASGLLPILANGKSKPWLGMVSAEQMPQLYNPAEGYIVTANQDVSHLSKADIFSLPMASHRADRISRLLRQNKQCNIDSMKSIQYDLFSHQAEKLLTMIRPHLPTTRKGKILANWDLLYEPKSTGAALFESVYHELLIEVFGSIFGNDRWRQFSGEILFAFFYSNFDAILLKKRSRWFGDRRRDEIIQAAVNRALAGPEVRYGEVNTFSIEHLLLGGKGGLFRLIRFDAGPFALPGGRATVLQSQMVSGLGKTKIDAPSLRFITGLGSDEALMNCPGGASDRRFSKYYAVGITDWLEGRYQLYSVDRGSQPNK